MKRFLLATVAVAALAAPGVSAAAECDARMNAYDERVMADPEKRQLVDVQARRDLRALRDAAVLLQMYGQNDACADVVAAIEEIASDPESMAKARNVRIEDAQASYEDRARTRAEKAVPIKEASATLTAEDLIGADLRNMNGKDLGSVDDLVMGKNGAMSYLIVSHGGFLGIGDKQIAVPFESAKISQDGDVVYINATEESLEKAPSFDRSDRSWLEDDAWRSKNRAFYSDDDKAAEKSMKDDKADAKKQ